MQLGCGSEHRHLGNSRLEPACMGKAQETGEGDATGRKACAYTFWSSTRCHLHKQVGDTIDGQVVILHVLGKQGASNHSKRMQLGCWSENRHVEYTHVEPACMEKTQDTGEGNAKGRTACVYTFWPSMRCQLHKRVGDKIDGKVVTWHVGSAMRA